MDKPFTIGEKINILFAVIMKPDGKPYTAKEVCISIGLPEPTLSSIRIRPNPNPAFSTLQELARFFNVPVSYFECSSEEECRLFISRIRNGLSEDYPPEFANPLLMKITFKAMGMSDYGRSELLRIAEIVETADKAIQEREQASAGS